MANKRLSITEIDQMKKMVRDGVAPEDIANHFKVAISSVHNYKNRFKAEGMDVPSVRGKRPTGAPILDQQGPTADPYRPTGQATLGQISSQDQSSGFKFIINGVSVQISSAAKSVNIGKDSLEVKFWATYY